MDRYTKHDQVTDDNSTETDYYMHDTEQLKPLTVRELLGLDLFSDADSMFALGGRATHLC